MYPLTSLWLLQLPMLKSSMSITTRASKVIFKCVVGIAEVEKNLFPVSLTGTTIQDGGTRARRDEPVPLQLVFKTSKLL